MKSETTSLADVAKALASIQSELARLGERITALEAAEAKTNTTAAPAAAAQPPARAEKLSEELILVISSAIAAYLGKKAHIRQIQLLGSAAWAQQGRVTIQASHALNSARSQP